LLKLCRGLLGVLFALSLLSIAIARGEIVQTSVLGAGKSITQAECAALPGAVWVTALTRNFCIRYYLSTAGGEGTRPVVFVQGDYVKTEDESTDDLTKEAARVSEIAGTTGIYLARIGRDGSSGSHDWRHSVLELHAANAALDAIKQKYGYSGFHIYGHSGGAILVGGLLSLRTDLGCVVIAEGRLVGTRKANLRDPALRDYSVADWIPIIARDHSARILVVSDPKDKIVPIGGQSPFIEKLRQAGGAAEQFLVDAGGFDPGFHHFTLPFADVAMHDCVRGASHDEIAADVAELVAESLAARHKAEAKDGGNRKK
jgi:hypothetical protein